MDLSLDDIIKKKNIKAGSQNPRGRSQQSSGARRNDRLTIRRTSNNKPLQSNRGRGSADKTPLRGLQNTNQQRGQFPNKNGSFVDARMKIIQKSRQRITDARDKLSELAKQTDARAKIKGRNTGAKVNRQVPGRRDRGSNGRGSASRGPVDRGNFNRNNTNFPPVLQRSIRNPAANMRDDLDPNSLIRCTINRPMPEFSVRPTITYDDEMNMELPMPVHPHNDLSSIKVVTQNEYNHYGQQEYMSSIPEPMYVDHYDPPHSVFNRQLESPRSLARSGVRMSQEMRARLDSPAKQFIVAPTSPPAFPGHRIVVSNLHSSVTHEDIKPIPDPARLMNVNGYPVTLKKGSLLGDCTTVSSVVRQAKHEQKKYSSLPKELVNFVNDICQDLTPERRGEVKDLITRYQDVFDIGTGRRGRTDIVQHRIDTGDAKPIRQVPRRLPLAKREEANLIIKELFEDIGPLVTSRLVRAGVAEVIYQQQKDAKKAVDAYHNRQLDGQPMKCLLVNPRPSAPSSGVLRSSNMPATPKFPGSSKSMVVPDISAIHKALFTSK